MEVFGVRSHAPLLLSRGNISYEFVFTHLLGRLLLSTGAIQSGTRSQYIGVPPFSCGCAACRAVRHRLTGRRPPPLWLRRCPRHLCGAKPHIHLPVLPKVVKPPPIFSPGFNCTRSGPSRRMLPETSGQLARSAGPRKSDRLSRQEQYGRPSPSTP